MSPAVLLQPKRHDYNTNHTTIATTTHCIPAFMKRSRTTRSALAHAVTLLLPTHTIFTLQLLLHSYCYTTVVVHTTAATCVLGFRSDSPLHLTIHLLNRTSTTSRRGRGRGHCSTVTTAATEGDAADKLIKAR
jgi:hypothetical protein